MPDGEIWSGNARMVIAKTLDGDIGLQTGHPPVLGILAEGSLVRILPEDGAGGEVVAAIGGGFLAIADDRVSILARQAELGAQVDKAAAQAALDAALQDAESAGAPRAGTESAEVRYARALLRATGEQS